MDRDLHFLERTAQRLDRADMEFALSLWQQPDTLHGLLGDLKLPDGVERLALGLGVDGGGPWIVLTRQGDFVTCLGRDMAPTGLHVVPATQVAALVARGRKRQVEVAAADAKVGDKHRFLGRLLRPGPWLAREDFQVFTAWNDALADEYVELMMAHLKAFSTLPDTLGKAWVRQPRAVEQPLRLYWNAYWAVPILGTLVAHDGRQRDQAQFVASTHLLRTASAIGLPWVFRLAWSAARFGKPLLAELKQVHREGEHYEKAAVEIALVTMALRHRSLRAEVEKLVAARPALARTWQAPEQDASDAADDGNYARQCLNDTEVMREAFLLLGRRFTVQVARAVGGAAAERWRTEDDVPDEVAGPMLVQAERRLLGIGASVAALCSAPAWLASVEAHELFLPREAISLLQGPYDSLVAMDLYRHHRADLDRDRTVRTTRVGRNDPCPCGSGKKAKRCCGTDTPSGTHPASTPAEP